MDMPPAGWYPDPYGVPGLLRWWDGSTWTQHTHEGSAPEPGDPGPATSLDATMAAAQPLKAAGEPRTTTDRAVPAPAAVQPPLRPEEATVADGTSIQATGTALTPVRPQAPAGQPGSAMAAGGSSWPNAGPAGTGSSWPNGGPPAQDHGTQVLLVSDVPWDDPVAPHPGRRRRLMLGGLLAGGTAVALALVALVVTSLSSSPPPATTAAQTPTAPAAAAAPSAQASSPASSATGTATPTVSTIPAGVSDNVSGLSYSLLSSPWATGCPPNLSNQQTMTWTAGEAAPDGQVTSGGNSQNWFGEACSGPLPGQYGYNGVASLEPTATNVANALDSYYGALNHQRTQLASTPVSVSGHPGWEVKYLLTYPDAASMGLTFNSEEGAVLVADQGTGLPPAVFFVSVPSNLNVTEVDTLAGSLTLTVTQQPGQPASTAGTGNPNGNGDGGGGGGNP